MIISVVVPIMNEEEGIELFYSEVKKETDRHPEVTWEFLWIDDGSSDGTLDKMLRLRQQDPRIKIIRFSRNFGSFSAIRAGFEHASGEAIICISADLQDPPSLFTAFLQEWRKGAQIVWGVRQARRDPFLKTFFANLFYRILSLIAIPNFPRSGMDVGIFDRQVIREFLRIRGRMNYSFITIYWMGFRQSQVGYVREERRLGYSKWPFFKRLSCAIDVITQFSDFPLRCMTYCGGVLLALGLVAGFITVFSPAAAVCLAGPWMFPAVCGLLGAQMIMLGILGTYLWRMSLEVRGRPQYIIMERHGLIDPDAGNNNRSTKPNP